MVLEVTALVRAFSRRAGFSLGGGAQGTPTTFLKPNVADDSRDRLVGYTKASQARVNTSDGAVGDLTAAARPSLQGDRFYYASPDA